jgi:hypothetical protein
MEHSILGMAAQRHGAAVPTISPFPPAMTSHNGTFTELFGFQDLAASPEQLPGILTTMNLVQQLPPARITVFSIRKISS